MKNIMLKLRYDGTSYCGWQRQANGVTVQGTLEDALNLVLGCPNGHSRNLRNAGSADPLDGLLHKIIGSSRTDSGVHAREYVCNFHTESTLEPSVIKRALNAKLPKDIAVLDAEYVAEDFHSRYAPKSKTYVYQVLNADSHDPFLRNYAYHVKFPLDVGAMNLAAAQFVGTFDFSAFTTAEGSLKNTVRTITDCRVEKAGNLVAISVTGESFLHNQVRIIAGTIIKVGQGKLSCEEIPRIVESGNRELAGATAPGLGLFLEKVSI